MEIFMKHAIIIIDIWKENMARVKKTKLISFLKFVESLKPVIVRRTTTELDDNVIPPVRDFGETINNTTHYFIKINKEDPLRIQKDTLMHEWAHCMVPWNSSVNHSDEWALAYAKIYRSLDEDSI
jgi:hypothetical protein